MDARWAPAAVAVAVVVLVGGVAVVVSGGDEPDSARPAPVAGPQRTPPPDNVDSLAGDPDEPASDETPDPNEPVSDETAGPPPDDAAPDSAGPVPPASLRPAGPTQQPRPSAAASPAGSPRPKPAPDRTTAPKPAPTRAPDSGDRSTFGFDAAYGTDEPREVIVQYGDSGSCPHQRVTHTVEESSDRVVVTLEADAMEPGRACTADYRQMLVPVKLQQPMGDRVLIDGSRGEAVPVDRSCNRQFANPPPPKDCNP